MKVDTHLAISERLCGRVVEIDAGRSLVELELLDEMKADSTGLVHGGFVFGAADYAALLAVNDPNVVLGSAEVRFLRPSRVGERLSFEARVENGAGKKRQVAVVARNGEGAEVFSGHFACFVLGRHVLDSGGP